MKPKMEIPIAHPEPDPTQLKGRYCAVVVCWILGTGCLLSWHCMLASVDYYVHMFPNYHPPRVLTLVYQPFSVATLAVLTYYEARINTRRRNLAGYLLFFLSTFMNLIVNLATPPKGGGIGAFIGISACAAAFGIADAHVQGGMVGELCYMAPEFMQSFLAGVAASGVLAISLRLFTRGVFEYSDTNLGLRSGAIMFFKISAAFEFLCVILYAYVFPKIPIIHYYRSKARSDTVVSCDLLSDIIEEDRMSTKALLMSNIDYALDLFLIYILTYSIFPGFMAEDTKCDILGSWYALTLIGIFNVSDLIGRQIPLYDSITMESRKGLMIISIARFAFMPALYSAARYDQPVSTIVLTSFLGLSNGYITVCVLTAAPRGFKGTEQNALGNILVLFILGGVLVGAASSWLWLLVKTW